MWGIYGLNQDIKIYLYNPIMLGEGVAIIAQVLFAAHVDPLDPLDVPKEYPKHIKLIPTTNYFTLHFDA